MKCSTPIVRKVTVVLSQKNVLQTTHLCTKVGGIMPQVSPQPTILITSSSTQGLGVPFNIASYSLLTYMIAHVCNLKPGDFVHTLGDAHVYLNHIQPLNIQIQRSPRPFPRLELRRQVSDIDKFVYDDIILHDYHPHPKIHMDMAV
ncbi:Thymidylate synthase [Geodia barretti]|uniref:Thymidylate synthase n=1 Tax=Geodia barretti TaxID=519541 RepID=A0AA35TV60_GEOBA|nr:Thymidylate synthase [Geodia barretti]